MDAMDAMDGVGGVWRGMERCARGGWGWGGGATR